MTSLLLIDVSNQAYKASAMNFSLTSGDVFTGGLFGFLVAFCKAIREVDARRVVATMDSPPYARNREFSDYKMGRPYEVVLADNASVTKRLMVEMFNLLNIPVWSKEGFESDDLIAYGARKYRYRFDKIVAMANDSDLYQLFDVHGFCIHKGKTGLYTKENYEKEFPNLSSIDYIRCLALAGTHNAVPGIHGVGMKVAQKILKDKDRLIKTLLQHKDMFHRNVSLIKLPHPSFEPCPTLRITPHTFNERIFMRFLGRYDINFTSSMRESLELLTR